MQLLLTLEVLCSPVVVLRKRDREAFRTRSLDEETQRG